MTAVRWTGPRPPDRDANPENMTRFTLAAVLDLTLDEVRPLFGASWPGYTNPTAMFAALRNAGRRWHQRAIRDAASGSLPWSRWGLARIQWEGPWTEPGVPMAARYRQTHWVGAARRDAEVGIFDVNATANGSGWCSLGDWSSKVVPWILESYPRANGRWHITHAIEVERR